MACFDNLIGLKELCGGSTPTSGIYLNDVGVDLNLISSVITKEYASPEEFLEAKINYAITSVKSEVYGHFASKIETKSIVENARIGYTLPNLVTVTGGGNRGVFLQVYNQANYLNLEISSIELHTDHTGVIPVLIYDLDQNLLLDTVNVDCTAGQIGITYCHKDYKSSKKYLNLWIGYDSTGINSYQTYTHKGQCCGVYSLTNSYIRAKGTTVSGTKIESNLTQIQDTAGLSITYSLSCDPYGWMCSFSNLLALPIAYKVASDIYRTGLMVTPQTRSNNSTTVNSEVMKGNFEWHEMKYRESLDSIMKRIFLPKDSACFQCISPSRTTIKLP